MQYKNLHKTSYKVVLVQTPHPTVTLDPEEMNSMEKKLETSRRRKWNMENGIWIWKMEGYEKNSFQKRALK